MAYAALVSLRNTVRFLGKFSRLSSLPICLDTLNYPSDEVGFLEQVIEKLDGRSRSERVDAMDGLIRDALCELEDAVASLFSDLMLIAQFDQTIGTDQIFSVYEQGINSFLEATKKITEEYYSPELPEEEDDDDDNDEDNESSGTDDFGGRKSKFVGFSDVLAKIKRDLITAYRNNELHVVSFVGLAGTGRSAFPWMIFDTGYITRLFKLRAWVRAGPIYQFREILLSIISQIDDDSGHKLLVAERDEKLFEYLYTKLQSGRYMIVLDDVRETQVWEYLRGLFPDENNGSRVFLTTHLHEIAQFANSSCIYPTRPLEKDECWNLLSEVIFGQGNPCPLELENAGKKMAENCEGLLLEVAKVASILCKVEQTPDNWNKVAAEMENSVAEDALDEMTEIIKIVGDSGAIRVRIRYDKIIERVFGVPAAIDGIIKKVFLNEYGFPAHVVSVVGMVGIGKTAIAREIFEDPWILQCYDHRVWITLGPKYGKERLFVDFLTQLDPNAGEMLMKGDETSIKHIITSILSHKRCFIVLDDVCHKRNLIALEDFLEDFKCEVLVTTRILGIPLYHTRYYGRHRVHEIPFLNKDESWSLLRQRVFGDEACPHELEKAGKLIAENCDGLPLMIVTVADLLSEADDESPEYWDEVAETRSSVFEDAYQKISKTLYPCYKDLDLELRMSFLYMAAFRRKYDIPVSKLFMLYTAEGINPPGSWDLLNFKIKYFEDFVLKSLVLANQYNGKFKSCCLHSVFWHFCVTEAGNDRFLHVVSCYADGLMEVLENQRRLCIHSNVLFAIKDVYDSIAAISTVHSLLCFGPLINIKYQYVLV